MKALKNLWSNIVKYIESLDDDVQQSNNISNVTVKGDLVGGRTKMNNVKISGTSISMNGNSITVNGKKFTGIKGNNVSISDGCIKVDGVTIVDGLSGEVDVKWEGDVANVDSHNLEITGNVTGDVESHNTTIGGNVGGKVTGHNVKVRGDVTGKVSGHNVSR